MAEYVPVQPLPGSQLGRAFHLSNYRIMTKMQRKRYRELKAKTAHIDPFIERNLLYVTGYNGSDYLPYDEQLRKLIKILTTYPN